MFANAQSMLLVQDGVSAQLFAVRESEAFPAVDAVATERVAAAPAARRVSPLFRRLRLATS
jgi:hypothetical protein